ncbi:MAG: tetratricopeptide repeat protein [Myxococcales bacterium]|nr:tetratricopeptide repeat protein [Myxococcales bacterium]
MKVLLPTQAFHRAALSTFLGELGFALAADEPATNGTRWTTWRRGEDYVALVTRARAATSGVKLVGPTEAALADQIAARFPSRSDREVLALAPGSVADRVRLSYELGTIAFMESEVAAEARRRVDALLLDPADVVRWASIESLTIDPESLAALADASGRYPELRAVHRRFAALVAAREDGTLSDVPTTDRWELLDRARAGARDGKWRRVAKAMDALLEESPWDDEGLLLRGLAHEGEGEMLEALFLLGAAESALASSERVRREVDSDGADDEGDDEEEDELDDSAVTNESLETVRAKLPALRERTVGADPAAQARAEPAVLRWLARWGESMQVGPIHGGARALRGRLPALEGLLTYLVGSHDGDEVMLEEALALVPDSPSIALALAHAAMKRDPEEGIERYRALRETLRTGASLSPAAQKIADTVGERERPSEGGILEILAKHAYDNEDYARAAQLGDELTRVEPDTGLGWQLRANARIFGLRHEEAVEACTEAIENLDRIYARGDEEGSIFFGDDPRPGMYFNRACVEAKLGRRDAALDSLRVAVRKDADYAEQAKTDDYFESLFEDPAFLAITSLEPAALRTPEERDPAWVMALVARARDQQQGGDVRGGLQTAQRAAELAEHLESPAVLAEALAVLGRMQALSGDTAAGLSTAERALAAASDPAVPGDVRAIVYAQHGLCLQAAMRLDEAEAAYERALEARRAAFGDAHPSLVKSLASIVGVALLRARPASEIEALVARGVDIAQAFLESPAPKDHVWAEAIDDLVSLLVRRALLRRSEGAPESAVQPLALALERLEEQRAIGYAPMAAVVEQIRQLAEELAQGAPSAEVAASAARVRDQAEAVLVPGPPAERRARLVFRRARALVEQLRGGGVADERIGQLLSDLVRGGDALAPELAQNEALAQLRAVLAKAAATEPTVLVTSAMALSMASMPGELDDALQRLEDLVAPIVAD